MGTVHSPHGQRIAPALPAGAYKTYQVLSPVQTHTSPATCEEADCQALANGWRTTVDERTSLGQEQAYYIRHDRSRRHFETANPDGLTTFEFPAGQTCFAQHRVSLDRPELFLVRGGDWRGDPSGAKPYQHSSPESWLDDFGTHQDNVARKIEKG